MRAVGAIAAALAAAGCWPPLDDLTQGSPGDGYRALVMGDAPLAYWRLDETEGPTARDETGHHDATYDEGVELAVPGALASGADHAIDIADPAQGGFTVGDPADLRFAENTPFTLEAWVRLRSWKTYGRLFSKEPSFGGTVLRQGYDVVITDQPSESMGFERFRDGVSSGAYASPPALDAWNHLVFVYDGQNVSAFVNGVVRGQSMSPEKLLPISAPLRIGGESFGDRPIDGSVDEVAIYGHALTEDEIKAHHAAGSGP